jgi:hypothetical protein
MDRRNNQGGLGLIWSAREIAREIGLTPKQTHHLLSMGYLPAQKIGGKWVTSQEALRQRFKPTGRDAAA